MLFRGKRYPSFTQRSLSFFAGLNYQERASFLHSIHPLVKLEALLFFSLGAFFSTSYHNSLLLFFFLLGGYRVGALGFGFFMKKFRFIFMFSLFIFLGQILWVREGDLLFSIKIWRINLPFFQEGVKNGLLIMLRFVNVIGSSYLFVATTDPGKLGYALMQAGLPYRFGFVLITALRFIPLFFQELYSIKNVQMAKGIDLEGISLKKFLRTIQYLFLPLIISALSKIDTLVISMEGRGFGLHEKRTYLDSQKLSPKEKIFIIFIPLVFLLFYRVLS